MGAMNSCKKYKIQTFFPNRLVYVSVPPSSGGTPPPDAPNEPGNKPEVTPENLGDKLFELQNGVKVGDREVKLGSDEFEKSMSVMNSNDADAKNRLLIMVRDLLIGSLAVSAFAAGITYLKNKLSTPEIADKSKDNHESTLQGDIDEMRKKTSDEIDALYREAGQAQSHLNEQTAGNPEHANEVNQIAEQLKALRKKDHEANADTTKTLNGLLAQKKIDKKEFKRVSELDPLAENFEGEWKKIAEDLKAKVSDEDLTRIKAAKTREGIAVKEIEKEYAVHLHNLREALKKIEESMNLEVERERAIKNLERSTGITIKPGSTFTYEGVMQSPGKEGEAPSFKKYQVKGKIKEVKFESVDVKDNAGNVIKKIPSASPTLVLQYEEKPAPGYEFGPNELKNEVTEDFPSIRFRELVDLWDVTPIIDTKTEAELSENDRKQGKSLEDYLKENFQEGDTFELREYSLKNNRNRDISGTDKVFKIIKINEDKKTITLDQPFQTSTVPPRTEQELTYGAFAKFFNRNDVMRPIDTLDALKEKLLLENLERNNRYKKLDGSPRSSSEYPPILVVPNEVLYYDSIPQQTFVIKEADDKNIVLDNGSVFTPASFYRWVKNNEVEKKSPEAEAAKETKLITNDDEREKVAEAGIERAKKELEERLKSGQTGEDIFGKEYSFANPENPSLPSVSYIDHVLTKTFWLNGKALYMIGEEIYNFIDGRLERGLKNRVGVVGELALNPVYRQMGAQFKSIKQATEGDAVNKFNETYSQYGVDDLLGRMGLTNDKFEFKALIYLLADKGFLRWDNQTIYEAANRINVLNEIDSSLTVFDNDSDLDKEEKLGKLFDKLFGVDTYRELKNKHDGAYNSVKNNFKSAAEKLGRSSLKEKLQTILYRHLQGDVVFPQEYEAYLQFAMEVGRLSIEDKIFFTIMGMGAVAEGKEGTPGATLLSQERMAQIEAGTLNIFPIVDYFMATFPIVDEDGKPIVERDKETGEILYEDGKPKIKKGTLTPEYYRKLMKEVLIPDLKTKFKRENFHNISSPSELVPGKSLTAFIQKDMIWNPDVRVRLADKASSDASRWDHDDMQDFAPQLGETTIEQLTVKAGGAKQQASVAGLKNAYAGLNHYTKITMEMFMNGMEKNDLATAQTNLRRMTDIMRSFVRFDAILDKRLYGGKDRSTLSDVEKKTTPGADSARIVQDHIDEMHNFIGELCNELGIKDIWNTVVKKGVDPRQQEEAIFKFGSVLEGALEQYRQKHDTGDGGYKAVAALMNKIQNKNGVPTIQGMIGSPDPEQAKKLKKAEGLKLYQEEEIKSKVDKIIELRGKTRKTQSQVRAESRQRLEDVISLAKNDNYGPITQEDVRLLDQEISALEAPIQDKNPGL